jgi:hypothetical protein
MRTLRLLLVMECLPTLGDGMVADAVVHEMNPPTIKLPAPSGMAIEGDALTPPLARAFVIPETCEYSSAQIA